jgi:hypothetical protein
LKQKCETLKDEKTFFEETLRKTLKENRLLVRGVVIKEEEVGIK